MVRLSFDPECPPLEPPDGADPTAWRAAMQGYRQHGVAADGRCTSCTQTWPCPARRDAERGLIRALSCISVRLGDLVHPIGSPHVVVRVTATGTCATPFMCGEHCEYPSPVLIEYFGPDGHHHVAHACEYEPHT